MKKIFQLYQIQIWAVLADMISIGNNNKKMKTRIALISFFVILMSAVSFFYCFTIGTGLKMYNSLDILPSMIMAVTSVIVLITTIFKVRGIIFGFKDYDLIMSLPVSTQGIVASRLLLLYTVNLLFTCMIMFPMMIAYGILGKPGILFYIIGIITMVFVPFIPIIIASILGTLITYVSSRFRYSNFVNILISIIVLIGIMGISLIIDDSGKKMADMSRVLTNKVNTIYPLSGMYQKAVCDYDLTALIAFLVISVGAFLCYSFIVGRLFRKMNTMILTGKSSVKYKMGELKLASPCKALYKKELKRYFSSTIYVLNTGFGIVLLTIGVIALLFIDKDKLFSDPQLSAMVGSSGTLLVSFCVVTCCTTMASISLEGKNLWIIKSLPVSPGTIFKAKIAVNMTIAAPAVIDAVIFSAILHTGFINCIITVLITVLYIIFTAVYGLIINLKFPNFNWTSETVVVKQSASCLIAVFTGMGVVAIQFLMVQFFPSFNIACAIFVFILTAADIALYKVLMSYGVRRFMKLQN